MDFKNKKKKLKKAHELIKPNLAISQKLKDIKNIFKRGNKPINELPNKSIKINKNINVPIADSQMINEKIDIPRMNKDEKEILKGNLHTKKAHKKEKIEQKSNKKIKDKKDSNLELNENELKNESNTKEINFDFDLSISKQYCFFWCCLNR